MAELTREGFNELVSKEVLEYLPEGYEAHVQEVHKPAGDYTGVGVSRKGSSIAAVINLEPYYTDYSNGGCLVDMLTDIADTAMKAMESARGEDINAQAQAIMKDYEKVKERLHIRVYPSKKVRDELIAQEFVDGLTVVPYVIITMSDEGCAAVAVTHELSDMWGVIGEKIISDAFKNAEKMLPAAIRDMHDIVGMEAEDGAPKMLVVTNNKKNYGASAIFYGGIMQEVGRRMGGDYFLIPSSVHEWIAVPYGDGAQARMLTRMLMDVNGTVVEERDVLADALYAYVDGEMRREVM